jgi:hypothetical protein
MSKHPTQPLKADVDGITLRFKKNSIAKYLTSLPGGDMNTLMSMPFPFTKADCVQFAQLIGYSLGGFGSLSYVSNAAYARAQREGVGGVYKHPTQPLDSKLRFKKNAIVAYLVSLAPFSVSSSRTAAFPWDIDDLIQIVQLTGITLAEFKALDYVTEEDYQCAKLQGGAALTPDEAPPVAAQPLVRLYNEFGSTTGSAHAKALADIVEDAAKEMAAYVKAHNICPRDAAGWSAGVLQQEWAHHTLRWAMMKKKSLDNQS